ncbi:hypothetical protein NJR55_07325 [Idiomarina sp. M1R2S28]|uniref:Uncharacterized protein n=1 Tax=Idiomarina rhizosphaerae TaxID=2961572 RepID=A0A9X2JSM1_9GAMM|nr:hypothetical protein [Idiomarina rhizosphaerae]MCP1339404.1 hypothetical protein [Idiomarina rhizosphaerae]
MSIYNIFLSQKDKAFLKALAKTIKSECSPESELTSIQNTIASSLGYNSWNALQKFNQCDVQFTDLASILKIAISHTVTELFNATDVNDASNELYSLFFGSSVWTEYGDNTPGNTINMCLLPLDHQGQYELVGFTSELDLVKKIESRLSTSLVMNPVISIDRKLISRRERPYAARRPILKYFESVEGIVFIESDTKICHFDYISSSEINITSDDIKHALMRCAFLSPSSYIYQFRIEKDLFVARVYREEINSSRNSLAGAVKIDSENRDLLKSRTHPVEGYSCVEDALIYAAFDDNFHMTPNENHSYFDFCRYSIAKIFELQSFASDLVKVADTFR